MKHAVLYHNLFTRLILQKSPGLLLESNFDFDNYFLFEK